MENGVLNVTIKNFKNIKNLEESIDGKSLFLLGDNEAGKSSFLQAVFSTLSNKDIPSDPISHGEEKSELIIDFVIDGKKYQAIRKFTLANKRGYFELKAPDGMTTNSVGLLEQIVGDISFNPFEFVELGNSAAGKKKQIEFIKKLIPAEDLEKLEKIEFSIKTDFENRTEKNRELKFLSSSYKELDEEEVETFKDPVDVNTLSNSIEEANQLNSIYKAKEKEIETLKQREKDGNEFIKKLNEQLKAARAKKNSIIDERKAAEEEIQQFQTVDEAEIEADKLKLQNSNVHNEKHSEIKRQLKVNEDYTNLKDEVENLTESIESKRLEKSKIIKEANLPIEGLEFSEDEILIDGLELNESQISTSKIMEIGVQLQKALNPKLKICKIPRGESLGTKRLESIKEFAKNNGYQLFIEKVDASKEKLTINLFEE